MSNIGMMNEVAGGHFDDDDEKMEYIKIHFYCDSCKKNTMEMTIRKDELEERKSLIGYCPECGKYGCHYVEE